MDKEKEITHKHDKGYKRIFSRNRNFLYFLNKYIQSDEFASWVKNIDEDDLVWINTTLIDDKFKKRDSDVIYKMKFKGREIIFYILLELQSGVDFSIPFRLLTYMTLILNYVFENTPKDERESKDYRLPAVIPITLYNGYDNWTAVRTFKEYLQDYTQFEKYIIDFEYYLIDINRITNAAESSVKQILDIIFMLDKKKSKDDMEKALNTASEHFRHMSDEDREDLIDWLRHVWLSNIADNKKKDELLKNFEKGEVSGMTSGLSLWFEDGRNEGKREGKEEAEQRAYKEKIELAKKLRKRGIPIAYILEDTGLTIEEIEE